MNASSAQQPASNTVNVVCRCDGYAQSHSDPFCGYCGRVACPPALVSEPDSQALQTDAPLIWTKAAGAAQPQLQLSVFAGKRIPGCVDSRRIVSDAGALNVTACFVNENRERPAALKVAGTTFSVQVPEFVSAQSDRAVCLRLSFDVHGSAKGRRLVADIPLQASGQKPKLASNDPRFEPFKEEAGAGRLYVFGGQPVVLNLSAAPGNFKDIDAIFLQPSGSDETLPAISFEIAGPRLLRMEFATEPLAEWLETLPDDQNELPARIMAGRLAHTFALGKLTLRRCLEPKLRLDGGSLQIRFEENADSHWCKLGGTEMLSVRGQENWQPQFSVAVASEGTELASAAELSAELNLETVDESIRIRGVKVRAVLRPSWLYAQQTAGKLRPRAKGVARLLLRNDNNPSVALDPLVLAEAEITITTVARDPIHMVAIDFGTCNTCAAFIRKQLDDPEPINLIERQAITPTLLYYFPLEDRISAERIEIQLAVGAEAESENLNRPGNEWYHRGIKTTLLHSALDPELGEPIKIGGFSYSADEVASHFLMVYFQKLARSKALDGRLVKKLVFTYPTNAPPLYRESLQRAINAALAQPATRFLSEPCALPASDEASAGGLWWFMKNNDQMAERKEVSLLVYDYGGGTTDLSLLKFTKLEDERWEVRILGVAGVNTCGGDDLTWRLAREFSRTAAQDAPHLYASQQKNPLAGVPQLLEALSDCQDFEGRKQWWVQLPSLIQMMDVEKPGMVGTPSVTTVDESILADMVEDEGGEFLASELKVHTRTIRVNPGRSSSGRYGVHSFDNWESSGKRIQRWDRGAKLLGQDFWLFDLGASRSGLLHEAEEAMVIARQMVQNLCANQKADYLLLIGQASQTCYFSERLKDVLRDCYEELSPGGDKTKLCVALGACHIYEFISQPEGSVLDLVPTLLRRIVGVRPKRLTAAPIFCEVLKSSLRRNEIQRVPARSGPSWDVLSRPKATVFYVDASYSNDVQSMSKCPLAAPLTKRAREGFESTDKAVCALVADLGEAAAFKTGGGVPEPLAALLEDALAAHPEWVSCLFFCFWPENLPAQAWIYAYQP